MHDIIIVQQRTGPMQRPVFVGNYPCRLVIAAAYCFLIHFYIFRHDIIITHTVVLLYIIGFNTFVFLV